MKMENTGMQKRDDSDDDDDDDTTNGILWFFFLLFHNSHTLQFKSFKGIFFVIVESEEISKTIVSCIY
jgi:hypothetical protein